ncbi:peptidoglycan-binding domain-containing protein, partial [Vibrio parahaemolyticus]
AFFHHHHKTHVRHATHTHHKHSHHSKSSALVRDAQTSLINLLYLKGNADGVLGPKTVKAIKNFQKDHGLRVTGKLTKETYNAIIKA